MKTNLINYLKGGTINMSLLYEGKAKRVFNTDQEGILRIEYKDEVTAGNGAKKIKCLEKGV